MEEEEEVILISPDKVCCPLHPNPQPQTFKPLNPRVRPVHTACAVYRVRRLGQYPSCYKRQSRKASDRASNANSLHSERQVYPRLIRVHLVGRLEVGFEKLSIRCLVESEERG